MTVNGFFTLEAGDRASWRDRTGDGALKELLDHTAKILYFSVVRIGHGHTDREQAAQKRVSTTEGLAVKAAQSRP